MYKIEISLKRVQTYIFEVPRLKTMLGANAQVGEVMRHELANQLGNRGTKLEWQQPQYKLPKDPLSKDPDNPCDAFSKGILARDGGHFIAVFDEDEKASQFMREAETLLAEELPGVLYEISKKPWSEADDSQEKSEQVFHEIAAQEEHLADLPVLQVCQETGREPASAQEKQEKPEEPEDQKKPKKDRPWEARSVTQRKDYGDQFYGGKTKDIIGLLGETLHPKKWKNPRDLQDLTSGGYLALIHADGNGIGKRYNDWRDKKVENETAIQKEARGEAFFHSMRVVVRRAVVDALKETFDAFPEKLARPYQVLMLGGDDLLMVCRADRALDFANHYARELENWVLADGKKLHVAIGVAIAQETYPLHRLHELAESLASSAKRLYRAPDGKARKSVIDWQVVTTSWFSGVAEARRQAERVVYETGDKTETLLLTKRPYTTEDLSKILKNTKDLDLVDVGAARSPLRALRSACERGRLSGEMAFARLPDKVRELIGVPVDSGNAEADNKKPSYTLWKNEGSFHLTEALDIIGVREISRLGTKRHES